MIADAPPIRCRAGIFCYATPSIRAAISGRALFSRVRKEFTTTKTICFEK